MKILHVFSTFDIGGPQVRFANMANNLSSDIEHLVFSMDGQYQAKAKLAKSSNVIFPEFIYQKHASLFKKLAVFINYIKQHKPDVVVTYNWGAIEWAIALFRFPQIKHLHFEEGFGPEEKSEQLARRIYFRRAVLRWKAKVIVPSSTLQNIATQIWKLPERSIHYLANGINIPSDYAPKALPVGTSPIRIGTLARLRKEKNLRRMIDAINQVNFPCELMIGGNGELEAELKSYVQEKGLTSKIHFLGHQAEPDAFMQKLDLFCLSSDTEQMPLSVLEAGANGLVVVATDVGDVKNIVSKSNRCFIDGQTTPALINSLNRAFEAKKYWADIGEENYQFVKNNFSTDAMNNEFLALIK